MIIGTFIYEDETDSFRGDIATLSFKFYDVEIVPNKKANDQSPDYRIITKTGVGHVELGSGWKQKSPLGVKYVSVSLDGPTFQAPLYASLFHEKTGNGAKLNWSRQKAARESKKAA